MLRYPKVKSYIKTTNTGLHQKSIDANVTTEIFLEGYANTMMESDFCLILSGDMQSSRLLFDTMVAGCVPVFPGSKYPLPFEHLVKYDGFAIRIGEKDWMREDGESLRKLHDENTKEDIVELWMKMLKYVRYIDWRVGDGVLEGIMGGVELNANGKAEPVPWT